MNWKLGAVWGVLLTLVQWLEYLAARGGFAGAQQWVLVITLGVFAYIGFSTYRLTRSFTNAGLTTMLGGFVVGLLGSLTLFFDHPALTAFGGVVESGFATAIYGLVVGTFGSFWARMQGTRGASQ